MIKTWSRWWARGKKVIEWLSKGWWWHEIILIVKRDKIVIDIDIVMYILTNELIYNLFVYYKKDSMYNIDYYIYIII